MNLITLILTRVLGGEPLLVLTPPAWDLGGIEQNGVVVTIEVVVENKSGREAEISFISTCECLRVAPAQLQMAPGEKASVELAFDPIEESGSVEKDIIIRTDLDQLPKALFLVHGEVTAKPLAAETVTGEAGETAEESATQAGSLEDGTLLESTSQGHIERRPMVAEFFASPGCRRCRRLLRRTIPGIEGRTRHGNGRNRR